MVRHLCVALAAMAAWGSVAVADEVWVGPLPYRDVTVVGVEGSALIFVCNGNRTLKPLTDVTTINLRGQDAFNQAETFLGQGLFDQAVGAYEQALRVAGPEHRTLVLHRQTLARENRRPGLPAPAAPKPQAGRCPHCNDTGLMRCGDCLRLGQPTGRAPCPDCGVRGRVTCPSCKGAWGVKCGLCSGTGKIKVDKPAPQRNPHADQRVRSTSIVRTEYRPCTYYSTTRQGCNGTGYFRTTNGYSPGPCSQCGEQPERQRGTIKCPTCNGAGMHGPCTTCAGEKRLTCIHCDKGAQSAGVPGPVAGMATLAASDGFADPAATADPGVWRFELPRARAAKASYDQQVRLAHSQYQQRLSDLRAQLALDLEAAMTEATQAGNLDEALRIRDARDAIEAGTAIPPTDGST